MSFKREKIDGLVLLGDHFPISPLTPLKSQCYLNYTDGKWPTIALHNMSFIRTHIYVDTRS